MAASEIIKRNWYRSLSFLYKIIGWDEKALVYLERIVKGFTTDEKDWGALGSACLRLKQWEKAEQCFARAAEISKQSPAYLYWLGRAKQEAGKEGEAIDLYDQAFREDRGLWEALAAKAQIKYNREEYDEALAAYLQCLQLKKDNPLLLNDIGLCYLRLNNLESAREYLFQAHQLKPGDEEITFNYATLLVRLGELRSAVILYNKINRGDAKEILTALGYCSGLLGEYDDSTRYYEQALLLEESRDIRQNLAVIYAKKGSYNKAFSLFAELLRENPYDSQLLNNLAWIYESAGNYRKAEDNYFRGLAVSGGEPQIAYNLACFLERQGKYFEAIEMIEYTKKNPEYSAAAWAFLAGLYKRLGAEKQAVECCNKALGLE